MRARHALFVLLLIACNSDPTDPRPTVLAEGRWAGDNACLDVRHTGTSTLRVGCGHGEFPVPVVRSDGTFDIDGTYAIEAGPVSPNPAPPAHYTGTFRNSTLTLTVIPSLSSIPPATYRLNFNPNATCGPACV